MKWIYITKVTLLLTYHYFYLSGYSTAIHYSNIVMNNSIETNFERIWFDLLIIALIFFDIIIAQKHKLFKVLYFLSLISIFSLSIYINYSIFEFKTFILNYIGYLSLIFTGSHFLKKIFTNK